MRLAAICAAPVAGLTLAACTSILGYGDIEVRDDGAAGSGAVGGSTGGTGGTAGTGGSVGGGGGCGDGWECRPSPPGGTLVLLPADDACPTGWESQEDLYNQLSVGCEACTCAAPTGTCSALLVSRYWQTGCFSLKDTQSDVSDGACIDVYEDVGSNQAYSYRIEVQPGGEACAPSTAAPEPLTRVLTCAVIGDAPSGCSGDAQCVLSGSGSKGRVCELYPGDVDCSSGRPDKRLLYGSVTDSRSCDCLCGAASGSFCAAAGVTLNSSQSCNGGELAFVPEGSCQDVGAHTSHNGYELDGGTYIPGACSPTDVTGGTVTFDEPHTLCCVE